MDSHENDTDIEEDDVNTSEDNASQEDDASDSELDLPTALAKLEETSRKLREANRESAGRRKKIKELDDQLKTFTNSGDDTTKKLAAAQVELQKANEQLRTYSLRDRFDAVTAKGKITFVDQVASRDAFTFAKEEFAKLADDANDDDYLDAVKDVVKSRPYLLKKPDKRDINSENRGGGDIFSTLNTDDIARDFGISNGQKEY